MLVAASLFTAVVSTARAQEDAWGSQPYPDPLRMSSLPLDSGQAVIPSRGEWQVSGSTAYFNVWQSTWHAGTIHREFGLLGTPFTPREVSLLAERHKNDQFNFIDLEGTETCLSVSAGLGGGLALSVRIPWIEIGAPRWDAIAEEFHARFGLSNMRRDWFPRGQAVVVVRGRRGMVERFAGNTGSGLGDARIAVTGRLGRWLGAEHVWVATVEAPTGSRGTLRGSGGWDTGVRWFGSWGGGRRQVRLGAGYTWLDPRGSWLGVRRANTWHALAEARAPLGRLDVRYSLRLDGSPLADFTSSEVGRASTYWTLGVLGRLGAGAWWAFDFGENFPTKAEAPDFSFHLLVGARFGSAAH